MMLKPWSFICLWIGIFLGCSSQSIQLGDNPDLIPTATPVTGPYGLELPRVSPTLAFPAANTGTSSFVFEQVFTTSDFGPNFQPVYLTFDPTPGSNALFIVSKSGKIFWVENIASPTPVTFLDVKGVVGATFSDGGEQGVLGLAFDPAYTTNGYFYVYYSTAGNASAPARRSVVARFQRASGSSNTADPASRKVMLEIAQPDCCDNHKAGMLVIGPSDGDLYISTGDGGQQGDPSNNARNLHLLLGKILRVHPDLTATSAPYYTIPSTNPYAVSGTRCGTTFTVPVGNCSEIWAYGLRNPWRFSIDRTTNNIWIGDVGYSTWEEVDMVPIASSSGTYFGWNECEGTAKPPGGSQGTCDLGTLPVATYGRGSGNSISGGLVYRGLEIPELEGLYIFGDYGAGDVWYLDSSNQMQAIGSVSAVVAFGEDDSGEVYAVSVAGQIFKLVRNHTDEVTFPTTLSATGLFSSVSTLAPAQGVIPYDVITPLWSDGAGKSRWIALPGSSQITFDPKGDWIFPTGTVLVKHFEIETNAGTKRLETRVLVNETNGWQGYTYRWRGDQSDADLLSTSDSESITLADGTPTTWSYPSRADCRRCHTSASGKVLGVRTRQLNRVITYSNGASDNQLRAWNHYGLFSTDIGIENQYEAYLPFEEIRSSAVRRKVWARGYLASNCSHCHRPLGGTPEDIDFQYDTALADMKVVDVRPQEEDLGLPDAYRIKSGAHASSVVWERMRRTDAYRMPPLASHIVDLASLDEIAAWIDAGP